MHPLPHVPRTFRDIVEADLRRAARLIIKVQDEIDWQWRIATPEGDYSITMTMPPEASARAAAIGHVGVFMHWKRAVAFVLASELASPDAVYAIGVAKAEHHHCMALITRTPKPWTAANFGAVEWLASSSADTTLVKLLPRAPRPLKPADVKELVAWFGTDGKFPAVHVPTGEVRGV